LFIIKANNARLFLQSRVVLWFILLFQQSPFLVAAAIGCLLIHLRAIGAAGTRISKHKTTVQIDKRETAIAVRLRQPLVVTGRTERPLHNSCATRSRSALDDGVFAALDAVDLVITAAGGDEGPLQIDTASFSPLADR
jgi:hypothetical protein